ncbi:MAG: glycosyltransferase [Lachnospiraceae bacterium]|nr:glycosyltransferase [Lachnospiraceae bacterium]
MQIHIFIAHMGIGGAERVCVNLSNELARRGHEVHIIVLNLKDDINTGYLDKSVQVHELGVSRLRYSAIPMLRYIKKIKPRFIFCFGNEMAVILNKLRKLSLIDVRIMVRVLNNINISLEKEDNVSPVVEQYLKNAQHQLADMDYVIAQCNAMGKQLTDKKVVEEARMSVIYNPVSDILIEDTEKARTEKKRGNKEIVFVGRLDPQKNPEDLIEIFDSLRAKRYDVTLRIVGGGYLEEKTKELVESKGLGERVIFDGIRKDMPQVYAGADAVVLTSNYEGMPNCLIEAIGCGIPVISYDCPIGPAEIIENDVNGYLIPMGNKDEFVDKLDMTLDRDWNRDSIKKTCDKFRVSNIADTYLTIFGRLNS